MKPEHVTIGDLLGRQHPFIIPPYQRAYAWEKEELDDFAGDLQHLQDARQAGGNPKHHFFGGTVSVQDHVPNSGPIYVVVDGQQRIATFGILLAAIAQEFLIMEVEAMASGDQPQAERAGAFRKKIIEELLRYNPVVSGVPTPSDKIVLSKADRAFYGNLLAGTLAACQRASHRRLADARDSLQRDLVWPVTRRTGIPLTDRITDLWSLKEVATDYCDVIHIVSESKAEAYRLFAVLNDRGRGLSDGDLLRASTLERLEASPAAQNEVEQHWDGILSREEPRIDQFLRSVFASRKGHRPGRHTLFDDFQAGFFPPNCDSQQLHDSVNRLRKDAEYFQQLLEGEWPYSQQTAVGQWDAGRLPILVSTLKHTLAMPILLAGAQTLTEIQFAQLVHILEKACFRYVHVCEAHVGPLAEIYNRESHEMWEKSPDYDLADLRRSLSDLLQLKAPEDLFRSQIPRRMTYRRSGKKILRYFLTTLDQHYEWFANGAAAASVDKSIVYDINVLQLEHIYPQSPAAEAPNMVPLTNDLGNLTFWGPGDNRAASNALYVEKRTRYHESRVKLNQVLSSSYIDWTPETVAERSAFLVDLASAVYRL